MDKAKHERGYMQKVRNARNEMFHVTSFLQESPRPNESR